MAPRHQLAARRRAVGHSQESLAEAVQVRAQSIARWERGLATPLARYRRPLAEGLQLSLAELEVLLDGEAEPTARGHQVPSWLDHYSSLEQGAAKLQTFEPISVPGLLQTEAYATGVMLASHLPVGMATVQARVRTRMCRQSVLSREPNPLELSCVIDESVLHRVTGDAAVMAGQLDHLASWAASPTVEIQVVSASSGALHSAAFGSFRLFTSPGANRPFIACIEDLTGFNYLDRPEAIDAHTQLFDHLTKVALPPSESIEIIRSAADRYRHAEIPSTDLPS